MAFLRSRLAALIAACCSDHSVFFSFRAVSTSWNCTSKPSGSTRASAVGSSCPSAGTTGSAFLQIDRKCWRRRRISSLEISAASFSRSSLAACRSSSGASPANERPEAASSPSMPSVIISSAASSGFSAGESAVATESSVSVTSFVPESALTVADASLRGCSLGASAPDKEVSRISIMSV